jgi:hypothetical protein
MSRKHRRRPDFGPSLFPIQTSAGDYRAWSFSDCLRWAADDRGILRRDRLQRIAQARNYQEAWVSHTADKPWREVLGETSSWWAAQRRKDKRTE